MTVKPFSISSFVSDHRVLSYYYVWMSSSVRDGHTFWHGKVIETTHGIKHIVAMRTKPINSKAVNLVFSNFSTEAFIFYILVLFVENERKLHYKNLRNNMPTQVDWLASVDTWSSGIVRYHQSQQKICICLSFTEKNFINNCFACKTDDQGFNNFHIFLKTSLLSSVKV